MTLPMIVPLLSCRCFPVASTAHAASRSTACGLVRDNSRHGRFKTLALLHRYVGYEAVNPIFWQQLVTGLSHYCADQAKGCSHVTAGPTESWPACATQPTKQWQ
ncbi:hypothetical protein HaLaN_19160 [Haematococcus lacustris]|uniref:Uncharacterized protein n=1 Tax=Haematococcus lacustris TaxID=44745 RepID=A0A699ZGU6_HAELA|nr:hypothetical protein HaLaN_19160 [Haematococcus lacustris]